MEETTIQFKLLNRLFKPTGDNFFDRELHNCSEDVIITESDAALILSWCESCMPINLPFAKKKTLTETLQEINSCYGQTFSISEEQQAFPIQQTINSVINSINNFPEEQFQSILYCKNLPHIYNESNIDNFKIPEAFLTCIAYINGVVTFDPTYAQYHTISYPPYLFLALIHLYLCSISVPLPTTEYTTEIQNSLKWEKITNNLMIYIMELISDTITENVWNQSHLIGNNLHQQFRKIKKLVSGISNEEELLQKYAQDEKTFNDITEAIPLSKSINVLPYILGLHLKTKRRIRFNLYIILISIFQQQDKWNTVDRLMHTLNNVIKTNKFNNYVIFNTNALVQLIQSDVVSEIFEKVNNKIN